MRLRRTGRSLVAVDRGSSSLRAIQLTRSRDGVRVVHWLNLEQPLSGPEDAPSESTVTKRTPSLSSTAGLDQFDSRRAGLLMGSSEVEYCLLTVPEAVWKQDPSVLVQAIRWEVGRQLSRPIEDAELGAWPLPAPMGGGANAMAVAASRTAVSAALESLGADPCECEWVEPAAPAVIRACRSSAQNSQGEIWGVLDLGFSAHRLYAAVESVPVFARQVRGSGKAWTELIATGLRTDSRVAEYYKRKCGVSADGAGCRTLMGAIDRPDQDAMPGVLLSLLKTSLGEMLADIERAFSFVMEQYPRRQAGSLVLVGGGARMPGLPEWIARELGIPVTLASPSGVLSLPPTHALAHPEVFSVMAGCVGMALAEVTP